MNNPPPVAGKHRRRDPEHDSSPKFQSPPKKNNVVEAANPPAAAAKQLSRGMPESNSTRPLETANFYIVGEKNGMGWIRYDKSAKLDSKKSANVSCINTQFTCPKPQV